MFKQQGLYSGDKREETWLSFSKLLPLLCFGKDNFYSLDPSVMLLANELPPAELHLLPSLNCCLLLAHWSIASSWEPSLALVPLGANSCGNLRRVFISKFQSRLNHINYESETIYQD